MSYLFRTPVRTSTTARITRVLSVVAAIVCALPAIGVAQSGPRDWNQSADPLQGAIGLHYGDLGGKGLAFRVPVRWWLYLQVAGGVWHTGDDRRHNVGFNLNYILRQDQRTRFYVNGGLGYFYHKKNTPGTPLAGDVNHLDEDWNVGGGVGLEYLQGRRWAWKLEGDFARLGKNGDIKVVPQIGLSYYW